MTKKKWWFVGNIIGFIITMLGLAFRESDEDIATVSIGLFIIFFCYIGLILDEIHWSDVKEEIKKLIGRK